MQVRFIVRKSTHNIKKIDRMIEETHMIIWVQNNHLKKMYTILDYETK